METVLGKKTTLISILSSDIVFLLQHVQEKKLITDRDYRKLKVNFRDSEQITIDLLDKLVDRGDDICLKFISLLHQEPIQKTFTRLGEHFSPQPPATCQEISAQRTSEVLEYKLSSVPRGFCVIINNVDFITMGTRKGSERDADALSKVFKWLGFTVELYKNQTSLEMLNLVHEISKRGDHGDIFVCCILTHGSNDGVFGIDGDIIRVKHILDQFNALNCPALANKPKLFFIEASRGTMHQVSVQVPFVEPERSKYPRLASEHTLPHGTKYQYTVPHGTKYQYTVQGSSDGPKGSESEHHMITIPVNSDFFVGMATIDGYFSYRNQRDGCFFTQSLCNQLTQNCPNEEDIQTIFLRVVDEVSSREVKIMKEAFKQTPESTSTLRKKVILRALPKGHTS
ncbi:caspase-8-like [Chanos chanos]|uniref:Caspase-8-like n=1 Tax=Chanos chanos TaxID=29144 RepID=A0A6J2W4R5_CHACN|nr:caspase-8-like [Chanos chanos]